MCAPLLKAIGKFESRREFAKKLGISPERLNAWLNNGVRIPKHYAEWIEQLTDGEISWQELAPHIAYFKCFSSSEITNTPIEALNLSLSRIQHPTFDTEPNKNVTTLLENIQQYGLQKPICTDTENHLIFGAKRLQIYQLLSKKTIPSWRLSLPDLINGKYSVEQLTKTFLASERATIGIALEKLLGNRQGKRTDKPQLVQNSAQVPSGKKTRDLIAEQLGFGSHFTYQAAKKVISQGAPALIDVIDQQLISISTAALLTELAPDKQISTLNLDFKKITVIANQIRKKELPKDFLVAKLDYLNSHPHGEIKHA